MNVPDIDRSIVRTHVAAIEAKHPIRIVGLAAARERRACVRRRRDGIFWRKSGRALDLLEHGRRRN